FGAPARNDFTSPPVPRLAELHDWLDYLQDLGVDTLLLGPLFESFTHGYDTADLRPVDRRLGTHQTLVPVPDPLHAPGMRLLLDGVFHHVGRSFWAFRDVQERREQSAYRDWFLLDFRKGSPRGDPFDYATWHGHYELVKLNVQNPAVKQHLFDAVRSWV